MTSGMRTALADSRSTTRNPLDLLQEIVEAHEWAFERSGRDELVIEVGGRWADYRLYFAWEDAISALQFACQVDMKVPSASKSGFYELLGQVNERLWLGHFDLDSDERAPTFRHTQLLRGAQGASVEQLEDLIDVALTECEKYYPAFQFSIWGGKSGPEAIAAAILETVAEA